MFWLLLVIGIQVYDKGPIALDANQRIATDSNHALYALS